MLDNRLDCIVEQKKYEINNFDCFIMIRCILNDYESKNVKSEILRKIGNVAREYNNIRINDRRWVLLNYPNQVDAYKARMTDEFYEYALDVMTIDYKKMNEACKPLKDLIEKTDKVRIVSPNTDITFSIKGMPAIPCVGDRNLPDGEIFTAPVKDSVNGIITYNTPSPYNGNVFNSVSLTFKDGKIIKATSNEKEDILNQIFDTDEGARYVGEFSFGLNPKIVYPMGDTLYDEKIIGSIHFTPGQCYRECSNGNDSSIHWDMVLIQRKDYGGGEIYFDNVLIRKDGSFTLPELKHLNK
jgi:aminopeptidase